MLTSSKIALSLALILATVPSALAAPKHAARHQTTIQQEVPAGSHLRLDSMRTPVRQPGNISAYGFERLGHLIQAFDDIGASRKTSAIELRLPSRPSHLQPASTCFRCWEGKSKCFPGAAGRPRVGEA